MLGWFGFPILIFFIWSSFATSNIVKMKERIPEAQIAQLFAELERLKSHKGEDLVYPAPAVDRYRQFAVKNVEELMKQGIKAAHPCIVSLMSEEGAATAKFCAENGIAIRTWALGEKNPSKNAEAKKLIMNVLNIKEQYPNLKIDIITDYAPDVHEHSHAHTHAAHRALSAILEIIRSAPLSENVKQRSMRAFQLLGEAEAAIHSIPIESVHFHEVGAVDTIIDIVCAAAGCEALGVARWLSSPLNVGSGTVVCQHGTLPVPAPATLALLRDAPIYAAGKPMERVTPTGAAVLRMLDVCYEPLPPMRILATGYGAGDSVGRAGPRRAPHRRRGSSETAGAEALPATRPRRSRTGSAPCISTTSPRRRKWPLQRPRSTRTTRRGTPPANSCSSCRTGSSTQWEADPRVSTRLTK